MNRLGKFLAVSLFVCGSAAHAQRDLRNIPDPDPEVERKTFQVADGFEVNLFAADPLLAKPIQMNWDAAGRLWVASSEVYPQIAPGQVANDRILILQDTDGDGRADKTSVFADGLLIPTGVEPGDGGAYVANSTELVHFRDTDGDGKADVRLVLLSGFGTEDTHHILHTFRTGPEGRLYFNQSIYIHSHIETPWGVRRLGGGGIWQFEPASRRLEVDARGWVNSWGHVFDAWGRQFATDGAGGEGINDVVPGASYVATPGAARILPGLNPGSPKYCGIEVVSGRHMPDDWQGSLITNDFRANRVCRFVLTPDGSGYSSREMPELIRSTHVAFRPIDVKMGPDGALYIADWYNPIIQHGEVDFRDPRRDHTRGRIWRVTAKGRPLVERPKLVDAPVPALLDALKAPEDWTRHFAKRVLVEKHRSTLGKELATWTAKLGPQDDHARLEALWLYQALDQVEPDLLRGLLKSGEPKARMAAARVAADWHDRLPRAAEWIAPLVDDDHPRVRLEAVRALARIPGSRSAELALKALDKPLDRTLDYGTWLAARDLESSWLPAVAAGKFDFGGNNRHLVYALQAVGSPSVLEPLLATLRAGKVAAEDEQNVLALIATLGGPKELGMVFDLAVADGALPGARRVALLNALLGAQRQRKARPEGDLARLGRLLKSPEDGVRSVAAVAAGAWALQELRPALGELARDPAMPTAVRRSACEGLAALGGAESAKALGDLGEAGQPAPTRLIAATALLALDRAKGAEQAARVLAEADPGLDTNDLFATCRERKDAAQALAAALKDRKIPADTAKLGLRVIRAGSQPEAALVDALTRAGGLGSASPPPSGKALEALVSQVQASGDPARGEAIFRRKDLACLNCHAIAGAGGRVGPDLTSIGASAPVDYLLESLYIPEKAVKEGYHATVVATDDGKVYTGIKIRQDADQLVLRDADDKEVIVPLKSIEEQKAAGSIMPAGLVDSVTTAEVVDLARFLSALGKVGPYSVGQARVARTWEVLEATPQNAQFLARSGVDAVATPTDALRWSPIYSLVSGRLPTGELPVLQPRPDDARTVFARTRIEVTTPGLIRFGVPSTDGLRLWIDGRPVEPRPDMTVDLGPGVHLFTLAADVARIREGLALDLRDQPGSPGLARPVLGK